MHKSNTKGDSTPVPVFRIQVLNQKGHHHMILLNQKGHHHMILQKTKKRIIKMNFVYLRLLVSILLLVQLCTGINRYCREAVNSVEIVKSCPSSKAEWDDAARRKDCSRLASKQNCTTAEKFRYHCVINGYRNVTLEVCAPTRIIFGHCVEFNVPGGVIQDQRSASCKAPFPKCDSIYNSTDAYKYPDCYKLVSLSDTIYSTTTTSRTNTVATAATASTKRTTTEIIGIIAAVVSVILILLIAAMIVVVCRRRCKVKRQRVLNDGVPDGEALKEINCTEEEDMLQRGCETDALSSAYNLNDTREEQNKCQNPATDILTKDSGGCKRTRTYSS